MKNSELLNKTEYLVKSLLASGNDEMAAFFQSALEDLILGSEDEIKDALGRLASCHKILQFASLSEKEEELLGEVISLAISAERSVSN